MFIKIGGILVIMTIQELLAEHTPPAVSENEVNIADAKLDRLLNQERRHNRTELAILAPAITVYIEALEDEPMTSLRQLIEAVQETVPAPYPVSKLGFMAYQKKILEETIKTVEIADQLVDRGRSFDEIDVTCLYQSPVVSVPYPQIDNVEKMLRDPAAKTRE